VTQDVESEQIPSEKSEKNFSSQSTPAKNNRYKTYKKTNKSNPNAKKFELNNKKARDRDASPLTA